MRMSSRSLTLQLARTISVAAVLGPLFSGCVYRMPIQQGNYLDPAVIAQVKPGMTHSQVRYCWARRWCRAPSTTRAGTTTTISSPSASRPLPAATWLYSSANNLVARVDSDVTAGALAALSTRGAQAPEPHGGGVH